LEDTDYYQNVIAIEAESSQNQPQEGKMVAMPTPHYMDIGLSQEEWDLPTRQYADATLTLSFPIQKVETVRTLTEKTKLEKLLANIFADSETFGKSINQKSMEDVIHKFLADKFVDQWNQGIGKYYPHWSEDESYDGCLANDGSTPAPEYMQKAGKWYFYDTLDECCEEHFGYDLEACVHGKQLEKYENPYSGKSEAETFSQGKSHGSGAESEAVKFTGGTISKSKAENFSQGNNESKKEALSQSAKFALLGVDLFEGKIERRKKNKKSTSVGLRRYLRTSRKAEETEDEEEVLEVTYTFTARGSYRVSHNLEYYVACTCRLFILTLADSLHTSFSASTTRSIRIFH
jgi:hypothetical protein